MSENQPNKPRKLVRTALAVGAMALGVIGVKQSIDSGEPNLGNALAAKIKGPLKPKQAIKDGLGEEYVVEDGDTPWSIAEAAYGKKYAIRPVVRLIEEQEANGELKVGGVVFLPENAKGGEPIDPAPEVQQK